MRLGVGVPPLPLPSIPPAHSTPLAQYNSAPGPSIEIPFLADQNIYSSLLFFPPLASPSHITFTSPTCSPYNFSSSNLLHQIILIDRLLQILFLQTPLFFQLHCLLEINPIFVVALVLVSLLLY